MTEQQSPPVPAEVASTKQWRKYLDATLQLVKAGQPSRERSLAITKIQATKRAESLPSVLRSAITTHRTDR